MLVLFMAIIDDVDADADVDVGALGHGDAQVDSLHSIDVDVDDAVADLDVAGDGDCVNAAAFLFCGQVGFHRYVDSRHFMSSCRRLLGLQHVYSQEVAYKCVRQ